MGAFCRIIQQNFSKMPGAYIDQLHTRTQISPVVHQYRRPPALGLKPCDSD